MEIDNENETPSTAVSLYGDTTDAMDDFPILKAFQEYVDKEQAKARHRMTTMTILFMVILFAVAGGLSFVIYSLNLRNQALNDRLIDFAMKEREVPAQQVIATHTAPQPVVVQPSQDNSALVAMVESLKTLIQEQKAAQSAAPQPPVVQEPQGPSPEQIAMEKKLKEQQERIEKTAALLKAQEEAIAAQKAQLREQELEAYRRKHYPEYYQRLEQQQIQQQIEAEQPPAKKPQPKAVKHPPAKPPKIVEVVQDIEIDDDELEDMLDTEDEDIEDIETEDDEFDDYYSEDDEDYSIPVDSGANWLIPKE